MRYLLLLPKALFSFLLFFAPIYSLAIPKVSNSLASISKEKKDTQHASLRYPIVLVHGATSAGPSLKVGPLHLGDYFLGVKEFFQKKGVREVAIPSFPPRISSLEIAIILNLFLQSRFPKQKVNIIAHSIGGLGARYLVAKLKSKNVASITMIATPNQGSPLANWAYKESTKNSLLYKVIRFFGFDFKRQRFIPELRPSFMKKVFNKKVRDVPHVTYYSVTGSASPKDFSLSPLLYVPYFILHLLENFKIESDGLVPKSSQIWGKHIQHFPFDHLKQINHNTLRPFGAKNGLKLYEAIFIQLQKDGF